MEYKGKLYGKVGNSHFPLLHTTDDWDKMEARIKELESNQKDSAYLVDIGSEAHIVVAENIANACDKIEKFCSGKYEFVYSKSLPIIK